MCVYINNIDGARVHLDEVLSAVSRFFLLLISCSWLRIWKRPHQLLRHRGCPLMRSVF